MQQLILNALLAVIRLETEAPDMHAAVLPPVEALIEFTRATDAEVQRLATENAQLKAQLALLTAATPEPEVPTFTIV